MVSREELARLLQFDNERFRDRVAADIAPSEYDEDCLARLDGDRPVVPDDGFPSPGDRERALIRRIRVFDEASLGIALSGPAYADNPVVYANRTLRDITGYALDDLRGANLRLLQGPETEAAAATDLREALSTWSRTTVTLTNYRSDGTPFTNKVTLVPVTDRAGSVVNWLGFQRPVDD